MRGRYAVSKPLCLVCVAAPVLLALGCGSAAGPGPGSGPAAKVTVSPRSATVESGSTRSFSATVTDAQGQQVAGAEVTWSADPAIGTIDSSTGVFTAAHVTTITLGEVTATVTGTDLRASADVTVTATAASLGYAGSSACLSCHADKHGPWRQSAHALALRPYEPGLPGVPDPAAGGVSASQVVYVLGGGVRAQQFLVPDDSGHEMLVHPSRYNTANGTWSAIHPQDWESRPWRVYCAGCHVTGFSEAIAAPTPFAEPGVGCEACHGPGSDHAASGDEADILSLQPSEGEITPQRAFDICASCHARGVSVNGVHRFAAGFMPGDTLETLYNPVSPDDQEAFWPQVGTAPHVSRLNYQQAIDLAQSPGHPSCANCHEPHGATGYRSQLRADPDTDALCRTCHSDVDTEVHSHHPTGKGLPSAPCIACHMPRTATAALPYDIASHAMRPIPPSATAPTLGWETMLPNSCMNASCHQQPDPSRPQMPVYSFTAAGLAAAESQWTAWYGG